MLLKDNIALVTGVANEYSIAYHIAKQFSEHGAKVILSYQGERLKENVTKLGKSLGAVGIYELDATNEEQMQAMFKDIDDNFGGLDTLVHAIAFAPKSELSGGITNSTSEGFLLSHHISAYTLISLSRYAAPLMEKRGGGSIQALTYVGSTLAIPNYNTMGVAKASLEASMRYLAYELGPKKIRVNAISPGPVKTVAARSIPGFMSMYNEAAKYSSMKEGISSEHPAGTAVYLASNLSAMVTGMIIFVDGGFHAVGLPMPEAPKES